MARGSAGTPPPRRAGAGSSPGRIGAAGPGLRLAIALALLLTACRGADSSADSSAGERAAARPVRAQSVVLVTVDTLRHDALGFAGNPQASTPALDRLASEGWVFERAYAHNVVTLPSHANLLTGRLPPEHGVRDNEGFVLPETVPTAASLLQRHGFATGAFVAAFPLDRRFGLARGFDVYDDRYPRAVGERPGDQVVGPALDWWRSRRGERRFLWVHLYEPHAPYRPPVELPAGRLPVADPYLGEVQASDAHLEPLLEEIRSEGSPVLVVFTSDHGEALGDHGEPTHGLFAYEAVLRVPLVLWSPGLPAARRADVAAHVDLLPTMLAALGVEPPEGLPGRDLLAGGTAGRVYFEALSTTFERGWAPLRGVLDGADKLISLPIPELYDVVADPQERFDLHQRRPELARRLAAMLPEEAEWPPRRDPDAPSDLDGLRALGYLGGQAPRRDRYGPEDDPKRLVHLHRAIYRALDLEEAGRHADAERVLRDILDERSDMGAAQHALARVLLAQERVAEAITVMEGSRDAGLASPRLERQLGLSLAEVGRHHEARAVLERLVERGDPSARVDLARAFLAAGDGGGAERTLRQALEDDPVDPEAHQTLALAAFAEGRYDAAAAAARRATELDPSLAPAWNLLGAARHQLGDLRGALDAWQRAVAADPASWDALFNQARVAEELGDTATLRHALERFVATAPPQRYGPQLSSARRALESLEADAGRRP